MNVFVSNFQRLKGHIFKEEGDGNEKAEGDANLDAASFCGAAYGIKVPNLSQYPVILNATGISVPKLPSTTPISNVEFLTEVFPCGLDPVGVVRLVDNENENAEEDEDRLSQLLSYLPVCWYSKIALAKHKRQMSIISIKFLSIPCIKFGF